MGITVGLIGLGDIAMHAHLPALLANPDVTLATTADTSPEARRRAEAAGVATTSDVDAVLDDPSIDAVVVATPPWVTPLLVRQALARGKYVLAEKPLAPTLEEAVVVADEPGAAERLQIGLTYRHHPAVERLRDVVQSGLLGGPLFVQASICDEPAEPDTAPRAHARRLRSLEHAPPMVSDGVHACDRLNLVLGASPVAVHGFSLRSDAAYATANTNVGILEYADGTLVRLEVVWLYPHLPSSEFVVTGPLGRAILDPPTFELTIDLLDGTHEHHAAPRPKTEVCFERQLASFVDACRNGAEPIPGIAEALASLELAERVASSAGLSSEPAR